ncbi:MAG: arylesterase [Betaproteobacteria bacterium]|nr:arylesterase [Betaproteobacteria bacterium]MDE2622534.1 arylesterase [Betaproteobacteria bacterium]
MRSFLLILLLCSACARAGTLLVLGDSLSAGYGLAPGEGWVTLLQGRLTARQMSWQVVNASISGDTTAGGLARLEDALRRDHPDWVLVELGANDGLRGLPLSAMRHNLDAIVTRARAHGARVLLIGMRLPPNYGPQYTEGFQRVYRDLASSRHLPLVPFLLDGVALDPALIQADQLHPTAEAQPRLLDNVWHVLAPLLSQR